MGNELPTTTAKRTTAPHRRAMDGWWRHLLHLLRWHVLPSNCSCFCMTQCHSNNNTNNMQHDNNIILYYFTATKPRQTHFGAKRNETQKVYTRNPLPSALVAHSLQLSFLSFCRTRSANIFGVMMKPSSTFGGLQQ